MCVIGRDEPYPYTSHLVELERRRPPNGSSRVPETWRVIRTPLQPSEWDKELHHHPDGDFRAYLVKGNSEGFRIGFNYQISQCKKATANMKLATKNPLVVADYLEKERQAGRVPGPLKKEEWPSVHINRFGVIPKPHQPGKWRLIVDLSQPKGRSVNDGIEPELCLLRYTSVDEAVKRCHRMGCRSWLTKLDVEAAYRIVPIHREDRQLLGMLWGEELFIDTALPFGLRSAPKILMP